jgi:hypothetical protein
MKLTLFLLIFYIFEIAQVFKQNFMDENKILVMIFNIDELVVGWRRSPSCSWLVELYNFFGLRQKSAQKPSENLVHQMRIQDGILFHQMRILSIRF